jgi:hypothetical protein
MKTLKMKDKFRIIAIVSYLLIILKGGMIGLPFFLWLVYTIFDFGNIDQLFALFAFMGVCMHLTKWKNKKLFTLLSFVLMLSPLISRMVQVPLEMFNYQAFQIPFAIFVLAYLIFIVLNFREKNQ